MEKIPYSAQTITEEDIAEVVKVLQSELITQGPRVQEFERQVAQFLGARYAVAVNSGTAALHLAVLSLGIGEEDTVVVSPITFVASANAALYCRAKVDFVDIDRNSRCLDVEKLRAKLQVKPKGWCKCVIVTDFAGFPAELEQLRGLADEYGFYIVEDAAHALGGEFFDSQGKLHRCASCSFADVAILSFHPVKHITCGEGGMLLTNQEYIWKKAHLLRAHGISRDPSRNPDTSQSWYYEMVELGFNYRITDFQCALGSSQFRRLERDLERRRLLAKRYDEALRDLPITQQVVPATIRHAYHLYIIEVPERNRLFEFLQSNAIRPQVHYIPVNSMPYYQSLGHEPLATPKALEYFGSCISLPLYPGLRDEEQEHVINTLRRFFNG